jgi:hypothetical protein
MGMNDDFKTVLNLFLGMLSKEGLLRGIDAETDMPLKLTHAFLTCLRDENDKDRARAMDFLTEEGHSRQWKDIADFYLKGLHCIKEEIEREIIKNDDFKSRLKALSLFLSNGNHSTKEQLSAEHLWSVFFPEGCNILTNRTVVMDALRNERRVRITSLNPDPITDPASEILFTSNVLLTVPPEGMEMENLNLSKSVKERLNKIIKEDQLYWYDHPIEIGAYDKNNEFLYGLNGLKEALHFEKERGNVPHGSKPVILMSVSVTHKGLHDIAAPYLEALLAETDYPDNLDIYLFTEKDTQDIVRDILIPASAGFLNRNRHDLMHIFGVDGEYGRHYSLLKAIALFWNTLIDDRIKATFKIDLDQVFPQNELVHETGKSAFDHFKTCLWGATGIDSKGAPVELGMLAGALVNDDVIHKGLFTPDITYPSGILKPDEMIFFNRLPQALSTEAEMMTRYTKEGFVNDTDECIERIHVTGGTTGILVESLKRHRPFTPSFIGRAEDQAYIISTLYNRPERLAYLHEAGLIMRHDKESFARGEVMDTQVAKLIGDYIRILYFSTLSNVISGGLNRVKKLMDPYTGCFISHIPLTIIHLRLALKAISLAYEGKTDWANELICSGAKRLSAAMDFCTCKDSGLKSQYEKERKAWRLYYDTMSVLGDSIRARNPIGLELMEKARNIVTRCMVKKRDT